MSSASVVPLPLHVAVAAVPAAFDAAAAAAPPVDDATQSARASNLAAEALLRDRVAHQMAQPPTDTNQSEEARFQAAASLALQQAAEDATLAFWAGTGLVVIGDKLPVQFAAQPAVTSNASTADLPAALAALALDDKAAVEKKDEVTVASAPEEDVVSAASSSTAEVVRTSATSASVAKATPVPSAASVASMVSVTSVVSELLNGGYKRGGAENDPETGWYDEIEIEDMEYDEDSETYTYPCPCGDKFRITKDDLLDGEDIARCASCSLLIKVIYDPDDLED